MTSPDSSITTPEGLLRRAGLRVTATRVAALKAVDDHQHATTDDVLGSIRSELGAVSIQAVYDVLHALTDADLVRRIEPAGHPARYERRTGDNHHHMVCRVCSAISDVDCDVGKAPCFTPPGTHGFVIETTEVTYWGLCPSCHVRDHTTEK